MYKSTYSTPSFSKSPLIRAPLALLEMIIYVADTLSKEVLKRGSTTTLTVACLLLVEGKAFHSIRQEEVSIWSGIYSIVSLFTWSCDLAT
jgi:hypothetical protein